MVKYKPPKVAAALKTCNACFNFGYFRKRPWDRHLIEIPSLGCSGHPSRGPGEIIERREDGQQRAGSKASYPGGCLELHLRRNSEKWCKTYSSQAPGFADGSVVIIRPQCRRLSKCGFDSQAEKILWRRKWQLAWEIQWTEEPSRLQSMGLQSQKRGSTDAPHTRI